MKFKLDLRKSAAENAELYYQKSKKAKQKLVGAKKALERALKKIEELKKEQTTVSGRISEKRLSIEADVKRLLVKDYINNKERIALNKEREIRKTKAGGFAQKKYQRHVDAMKSMTSDWIEHNLMKRGVLRPPYDEIEIICKDNTLKQKIESMVKKLNLEQKNAYHKGKNRRD